MDDGQRRGRSRGGDGRGGAVLTTYRSLRLAMVVLVVTLSAAVLLATARSGCWRNSISAYYYSSAHNVFVGVLCALGVSLIVYKGSSDTEDVVLNLAGFLAFVVAAVPTAPPRQGSCGWLDLVSVEGLSRSVQDNVWVILLSGVVAVVVALSIARRTGTRLALHPVASWIRRAGVVIVAAGAVCLAFFPDQFVRHGHMVAAVLMFVGFIGVAVASAVSASYTPDGARYVQAYRAIAGAMLATLVAVCIVHLGSPGWGHLILVTEALLVAEFATFWIVQTVELWNVVDRTDLYEGGEAPQAL